MGHNKNALSDQALKRRLIQNNDAAKDLRVVWRDEGHPGLELFGTPERATWYFRPSINGKRIRVKIGVWPSLTNSAARDVTRTWAEATAVKVAAGVDVIEERAAQREAVRIGADIPTLRDAIRDRYWRHHLSSLRTGARKRDHLITGFADFLNIPVDKIDASKFDNMLDTWEKRAPQSAATAIKTAKPLWRWMVTKGWCVDILADRKPMKPLVRERSLSRAELARIWDATASESLVTGPLVRAMILTAQRQSEVAGMRFGELDLATGVWMIPASRTKTAKKYVVYLASAALAEITTAIEYSNASEPKDLVFTYSGLQFSGWSALGKRLKGRARLNEPWTFHDFRATFLSRLAEVNVPMVVADSCLNHAASQSQSRIQRIYLRSDLAGPKRAAMEQWASIVANAITANNHGNVLLLGDTA